MRHTEKQLALRVFKRVLGESEKMWIRKKIWIVKRSCKTPITYRTEWIVANPDSNYIIKKNDFKSKYNFFFVNLPLRL